jgi:hypothetical protein
MTKWMAVVVVLALSIAGATELWGRSYVVAPNGNDANAGTIAQPWRTLARANAILIAGDTVFIRAGTYTDPISPVSSGAAGNPLVYMNYQSEVCSLYVSGCAVNLIGKNYVFVQGLRVQMAEFINNYVLNISGGGYNAILDCKLYGGSTHNNPYWGDWPSFKLNNTNYNRFIGNFLDRQDHDITSDALRGDGLGVHGTSKYNIIEGNTVVNVSHFGIAVPYGVIGESYNIVRNNRIYDCHVGIGNTDQTSRCLYEGNLVWAPGEVNTYRGGVSCEFSPEKCIIRYNAFYDDSTSTGSLLANPGSNNSFVTNSAVSTPIDNRVYHNTFMGQSGTGVDRCSIFLQNDNPGVWDFGRNSFVNNIIAYPNKRAGSYPISWQDRGKTLAEVTDRFRGNLVWRGAPGEVVANWGVSGGTDHAFTLAQLKSQMPAAWEYTNFEASPQWTDSTSTQDNRSFMLSATSPCIDRGVALARTRQSSSNATAIYVTDASYFHYAWSGTSFDRGDSVYIDGVRAELQSIDYQNNILYTTSQVTVANDAGVYLLASYYTVGGYQNRLKGAAPDVGAFETGGTAPVVQAPAAPALLSPAEGTTGVALTAQMQWAASPTATSNQVQVSTSSSFLSNVVDQSGITGTSYPLSTLGFSTTYFWRVRALNAVGAGPWSSPGQFVTSGDVGGPGKTVSNVVNNGDFENGSAGWTFYTNGAGSFSAAGPAYGGSLAGMISVVQTGTNIQLYQSGIALQPSTVYRLSFVAYSNTGHDISVGLMQHVSPYTNYGLLTKKVDLSQGWKADTVYLRTSDFTSPVTDARLQFWFPGFAAAGDLYWIDDVVLEEVPAPAVPEPPHFVSPLPLAGDQSLTLPIRWSASALADAYDFELASDSLFTRMVVDTVMTDTMATVGPLQANTRYYRRVRAINISGNGSYCRTCYFNTAIMKTTDARFADDVPTVYLLGQNYPNPFNPTTTLRYSLPAGSRVSLTVHNTLGAEVANLEQGEQPAGTHEVLFDASRLASGTYFYTLRAPGFTETKRMALVK